MMDIYFPIRIKTTPLRDWHIELELNKMGLSACWDQNGLDLDEMEQHGCLTLQPGDC